MYICYIIDINAQVTGLRGMFSLNVQPKTEVGRRCTSPPVPLSLFRFSLSHSSFFFSFSTFWIRLNTSQAVSLFAMECVRYGASNKPSRRNKHSPPTGTHPNDWRRHAEKSRPQTRRLQRVTKAGKLTQEMKSHSLSRKLIALKNKREK